MERNEEDEIIDESPIKGESTSEQGSPVHSQKARGAFDARKKAATGNNNRKRLIISVAAIVIVFITAVIVGWSLLIGKMKEGTTDIDEASIKKDAALEVTEGKDDSMKQYMEEKLRKEKEDEDRAQAEKDRLAQEEADRNAQQNNKPNNNRPQSGETSSGQGQNPQLTPQQRKLSSAQVITPLVQDVSSYGANGSQSKAQSSTASSSQRAPASMGLMNDEGASLGGGSTRTRGSLSDLGGTEFSAGKAYFMPSRKYLLAHNTYASCITYTEIVTDQPGIIDCRLTEPVYSADGSTVLMDAGDRLTGEQSVEVKPGQVRVFTSWTELETQTGIRAKLASLGAGPMGASGTEAWIDNHYRQRFAGAIVLSIVQDALQAATNLTQKSGSGSGSGYTVNNSEQNVENMASKALDNSLNIQPTAHIPAGTVMTVIVARDIDFSSVYENR